MQALAALLPVTRGMAGGMWQGEWSRAGMPLGFLGLPDSPVAAVLLLVLLLTVTYVLLAVFVKVGVPSPGRTDSVQPETDDDLRGDVDAPDPDWPSETVPHDDAEDAGTLPAGSEIPEYVREPFSIESVRVREVRISLGDTASRVMTAFRPGDGETVPLVQRDAAGRASSVSRTYRVGRRTVTLVLERASSDEPLRLTRISTE